MDFEIEVSFFSFSKKMVSWIDILQCKKKIFEKNRLIFDIENWIWKCDFSTFQLSHNTPIYNIQPFPWSPLFFFDKIKLILDTPSLHKKTELTLGHIAVGRTWNRLVEAVLQILHWWPIWSCRRLQSTS